jgi:hypothetical protein
MKNKKSEGYVLYFWLILNLLIIGVAIYISMAMFFSAKADVRIKESDSLGNKLISAASYNGYLNKKILDSDFNIFQETNLNPAMFPNPGKFYFNITVFQDGNAVKSIVAGSKDFEVYCELPSESYAKCFRKNLIVLDKNSNKGFEIKITAGSNQLGEIL